MSRDVHRELVQFPGRALTPGGDSLVDLAMLRLLGRPAQPGSELVPEEPVSDHWKINRTMGSMRSISNRMAEGDRGQPEGAPEYPISGSARLVQHWPG